MTLSSPVRDALYVDFLGDLLRLRDVLQEGKYRQNSTTSPAQQRQHRSSSVTAAAAAIAEAAAGQVAA